MKNRTELQDDCFHLGLTMAGAVTAGCYTAGVLDYLFELLDLWEKAKNKQATEFKDFQGLIPPHEVKIDVMGGASAGGMCSVMAALHILNGEVKPIREVPKDPSVPTGNTLYDSWVIMDDYDFEKSQKIPNKTFISLWDLDDLTNTKHVKSLLNSSFIERIAKRAFSNPKNLDLKEQVARLPSYFSKNMQILLSHCLLEGLPIRVNFETEIAKTGRKSIIPNHTTYEHYIVSHYHLNAGEKPDPSHYLSFNPYDDKDKENIINSTIATGAFPFGLKFRSFSEDNFDVKYLENVFRRVITGDFGEATPKLGDLKLKSFPKKVSSTTVDGGALNNEPYREVMSILKSQNLKTNASAMPSHGMVMIDPFPDRAKGQDVNDGVTDLVDLLRKMLGTLLNQSRVKRREMLETDNDLYFRSIVFPRKWKIYNAGKRKPLDHPLDCGTLGGFGGLFDINFRVHDFFLGRNNARNFIRYFFSMPYDKDTGMVHPIHVNWTDEMVKAFKIEKNGKSFLPIIPDLYLLLESEDERKNKRSSYDLEENSYFDPSVLLSAKPKIEDRIFRIISLLLQKNNSKTADGKSNERKPFTKSNAWIENVNKKGVLRKSFSKIVGWVLGILIYLGKKPLASKITDLIISTILSDIEKTGKLTDYKK